MGNIRIERIPIEAFSLGKLRGDHLMLVYQQDALDYGYYQDRWWVMEGTRDLGPDGTITVGVDGAEGTKTLSQANGNKSAQDLLDAIKYPWWRGSHIIPSTDPFSDWSTMAAVARNIDDQFYPYYAYSFPFDPTPTSNSSSLIASLLYYIGIDVAQNMPSTFFTYTTGTHTLFGTSEDDELQIEWSFNTLLGGEGNDIMGGTNDQMRIEKFYGGKGDDEIQWSKGFNIIHGGQPGLDYAADGIDLADYTEVDIVTIELSTAAIPHVLPDFIAHHSGGTDYLFSIERVRWNKDSDHIIMGEGVEILEDRLLFDLDDELPGERGDILDFSPQRHGLLLAPSDQPDIVLVGTGSSSGGGFQGEGGVWAKSLEWMIGSSVADRIYAGTTLRGVEGGAGGDLLSGYHSAAFTGLSPEGYDIELSGGEGNDTIVSGLGRSLATGGDGDDVFVLADLSWGTDTVEFVIADAGTTDRLFVPYNLLKPYSDYSTDGSTLFPILGGMSPLDGRSAFSDLPQNQGLGNGAVAYQQGYYYLMWQTQYDSIFVPDASDGIVDIAGQIYFDRDGGDLLIHVFSGDAVPGTFYNNDDESEPYEYTMVGINLETEAVVRVKSFHEGMLGIRFYDFGEGTPFDFDNFQGPGSTYLHPNWDIAANYFTNGGTLAAPLETEPATPFFDLPDEGEPDQRQRLDGGDGDDMVVAGLTSRMVASAAVTGTAYSSGSDLYGGGGNDTLIGAEKNDRLDGGTGADAMTGGGGSDTYLVDEAGDGVVELDIEGTDRVVSGIDYRLADNVEHLELAGMAVLGEGNALANRITGTPGANTLRGGDGNDTLYGAGGNDLLEGGEGSDTFVYVYGNGTVRVVDSGASADSDVLRLVGVSAEDVDLYVSGSDPDSILLRLADGGRIVLDGFALGHSIESVRFDGGTEWDRAFLLAGAAAGGTLLNDAPVANTDDGYYTHLADVVIPKSGLLANDTDADGDALAIISAATDTAGATASVTAEGDVRLTVSPGQTGLVAFTYGLSDGRGGAASGRGEVTFFPNAAPIPTGTGIAAQSAEAGSLWSFTVPADAFQDPDGHSMVYTAALASGSPLPSWLAYDPDTRVFEGTPPSGFADTLDIRITATDGVASASTDFRLGISAGGSGPVTGTPGSDDLAGTSGNDVFDAQGGNDRQDGGAGDDTFLATGDAGFDIYLGGDGYDLIQGSAGNDIIGVGALTGVEAIDGGAGTDILRLTSGSNVLNLAGITLNGIERIEGGAGNDTITGSAGADTIAGGPGNDRLYGGAGGDTFVFSGQSGYDFYNGGAGTDTIKGSSGSDTLVLRHGSQDLLSIERLSLGTGLDTLRLGPGNDTLDLSRLAVTGLDRIEAGAGNDRITGSSASERIYGGTGHDVFVFRGDFGRDTIVDFELGRPLIRRFDVIDLSDTGYTSFRDLMSHAHQVGHDTVITESDSGSTLRLAGIARWQLKADDFIL